MAEGVLPPTKEGIGAMTKLDQLYAEKGKKFDEICALLSRELGYGEFATVSAEDRNHVELEAEQRVKEWEETTEFRTRANIRPITPLRRLLSQHQYIGERILDEQEIEVGSWRTRNDLGGGRRPFDSLAGASVSAGVLRFCAKGILREECANGYVWSPTARMEAASP